MSFSIESIQPIIQWLHTNAHFALGITFLIAFAESLAIVGSIIPGSVTMTAVGILAGSGVLRIDLSILSATLGAIAGDGASYVLGYYFSERLTKMWPFKRYPHWLIYGKEFFIRHGKKSVLIGRFAGPLRAIIPVIAGMMRMNQWHFYIANIISGFLWSILYMLPGVMIGAAASELSPETAIRFCLILLGLLIGIWLCGIFLKWLFIQMHLIISHRLHAFWLTNAIKPRLSKLFAFITPPDESQHEFTALWVIALLLCTILLIILSICVVSSSSLHAFNLAIHYAFQSFKTTSFDKFFVCVNQLGYFSVSGTLTILVIAAICFKKQWHLLYYWLSLLLWTGIVISICHQTIHNVYPLHIFTIPRYNSFPAAGIAYSTSIFLSLFLFIQQHVKLPCKAWIRSIIASVLFAYGLSTLYLDEAWLSDVIGGYLLGFMITITHWIFFRARVKKQALSLHIFMLILLATLFITFTFSCFINFKNSIQAHQLHFTEYLITNEQWWDQNETLLPRFQRNRFGRADSPFNIQYAGILQDFENTLTQLGWQKQHETFYQSIVKKLTNHPMRHLTPIFTPLYLNRKPVLIMRYYQIRSKTIFVLRLWRSNYHLVGQDNPIWIGYIHAHPMLNKNLKKRPFMTMLPGFLAHTLEEQNYHVKTVIPIKKDGPLLSESAPVILIRQ